MCTVNNIAELLAVIIAILMIAGFVMIPVLGFYYDDIKQWLIVARIKIIRYIQKMGA